MFSSKNSDEIKVVDFGISGTQSLINIDYTEAGSVRYFAPEVLSSKAPAHPSIDIWCMGCILFWMLVGYSPFPQKTREEVFNHILKAKLRMTKSVQSLIEKMLQIDISKRITMTEMVQHKWLCQSVENIRETEKKENRKEMQNLVKIHQINSSLKSFESIDAQVNDAISPKNKKDEQRRKTEGTKSNLPQGIPSQRCISQCNQQIYRKSSFNQVELDLKLLKDDVFVKQDYQRQIVANQKRSLMRRLPQISQQDISVSSKKHKNGQRVLIKHTKERDINLSNYDSSGITPKQNNITPVTRKSFTNSLVSVPLISIKSFNGLSKDSSAVKENQVIKISSHLKTNPFNSTSKEDIFIKFTNSNLSNSDIFSKIKGEKGMSPLNQPILTEYSPQSYYKDNKRILFKQKDTKLINTKMVEITNFSSAHNSTTNNFNKEKSNLISNPQILNLAEISQSEYRRLNKYPIKIKIE